MATNRGSNINKGLLRVGVDSMTGLLLVTGKPRHLPHFFSFRFGVIINTLNTQEATSLNFDFASDI